MKKFIIRYECREKYFKEYAEENNMEDWELDEAINNCFCQVMTEDKYNFIESWTDSNSEWFGVVYYTDYTVETDLTKSKVENDFKDIKDKYDFIDVILVDEIPSDDER